MASTQIRILCENRAGLPLHIMGEHGFSALIRHRATTLLLDTGQGLALANNAKALGIDLAELDHLVISHGHYDHTGGLGQMPPQKTRATFHAHPGIFTPKYLRPTQGKDPIFIGTSMTAEGVERHLNLEMHLTTQLCEISPGIWFSGQIPRVTDFEALDPDLILKTHTGFETDPLLDDTALLLETDSGPVIVAGCAHSGIVNIMEHFSKELNLDRFHSVLGGTHLAFNSSENQLEKTMDAFDRFHLRKIAVSHCTGNVAAARLHARFGKRFAFADAGWHIAF